jgi:antitoxin component of MazEF toxin-antitoxin module
MVKKLTRLGNSYGVVIDRAILDLLKITPDTPLELSTDGDGLVIRPLRTADRDEALRVGRRIMTEHARNLRKLAR